jgi:AraC-like DNA-binding protein
MVVKDALTKLGIHYTEVRLGEAEIPGSISVWQHDQLCQLLKAVDLIVIEDEKGFLLNKIKGIIIDLVYAAEAPLPMSLPQYLSKQLNCGYSYLSIIFSESNGMSIERFMIQQKIERVKELLLHTNLTLTEIAYKMDYSSVAHLSGQFKITTGLTTSRFKKLNKSR